MERTLRTQSRRINDELAALPESLEDDPQGKLVPLCEEFTFKLNELVEGRGASRSFQLQMKPHFAKLKELLEKTKPELATTEITDPKDNRI
jgi:hypothetical protein